MVLQYQILISNDRNAFKVPEILLSQVYENLVFFLFHVNLDSGALSVA
ncbi:unnamed protein product [Rhodiola kirilowii]